MEILWIACNLTSCNDIALSPDFIDVTHAQKAEGSAGSQSPKSYGSATDKIVCGDKLCGAEEKSEQGNIGRAK